MARTSLRSSPPFAVERALKALGANLRTARLRRNLTLEDVARKVGVTRQLVASAERGKPSTSIGVYAALLWVVGMVDRLAEVASPETDEEGTALARSRERSRAARKRLGNDF